MRSETGDELRVMRCTLAASWQPGRRRDVPRFSSRPLDIDIIFYDSLVFTGPGNLQVPRPELKHAFVLKPLADIAPDFRDPLSGLTLAQLWAAHPAREAPPTVYPESDSD